ncbi:ParA family protein [Natrialba aegyptia]|uniref:Putative plasmid partitioning protein Soj n=1 Tax=Natrialba aegyptia DSM 13077 TaxID=1227491 RepID=M0ASA6_9EURY|nr:ParA family protein [Natrialba aegyptia]ELZ01576.1 putative plasmid partitioning protein Soj [Natrialba aegyptia DSM 13077]
MPQQAPQAHGPPRVVVANAKGGVGKTTVAANLVGALSQRDLDVLAVDADPQGNLTEGLGHLDAYEADPPTLFDVLLDIDSRDEIVALVQEGDEADLVPASIDMLGASMELAAAHFLAELHNGDLVLEADVVDTVTDAIELMTQLVTPATIGTDPHGYGLLDDALSRIDDGYDVVVIDAPPGHNPMFKNALYAAPNLIVPATAEASSKGAVDRLFDEIAAFEDDTGVFVEERLAVVNRIRMSTKAAEQMTTFLQSVFEDVPVYEVPERVALSYAYDAGESIFEYDPEADVAATFDDAAAHLVDDLSHEEET